MPSDRENNDEGRPRPEQRVSARRAICLTASLGLFVIVGCGDDPVGPSPKSTVSSTTAPTTTPTTPTTGGTTSDTGVTDTAPSNGGNSTASTTTPGEQDSIPSDPTTPP